MLDGTVTDLLEGQALSGKAVKNVDIMSASWGPSDDGRTVEGGGTLAKQAFVTGVSEVNNTASFENNQN